MKRSIQLEKRTWDIQPQAAWDGRRRGEEKRKKEEERGRERQREGERDEAADDSLQKREANVIGS